MHRSIICFLFYVVTFCVVAQPEIDWKKSFGGSENDSSKDIIRVSSGGYMIASLTYSTDGDMIDNTWGREIWLMRLDQNGELIWQNWYGTILTTASSINVRETIDEGFIVATTVGMDNSGIACELANDLQGWLFKVNSNGDLIWENCYGGTDSDGFSSIELTSDGGFILCGGSHSSDGDLLGNNGLNDIWVLKLNSQGDLIWSRNYGGTGMEAGSHVIETTDGGYFVAGDGRSNDILFEDCNPYSTINNTGLFIRLSEIGDVLWTRCYGGNGNEIVNKVFESADGSFFIVGATSSSDGAIQVQHGGYDAWVIRLDEDGNLFDNRTFGGSSDDYFLDFVMWPLGVLNLIGYTHSIDGDIVDNHGQTDGWIVSMDADLEIAWKETFGGSDFDFGRSLTRANDGGIVFCGNSASMDGDVTTNNGSGDAWIVKLKPWETSIEELSHVQKLEVHPNPSSDFLFLDLDLPATIKIFDPLGRCVIYTMLDQTRNTIPVHDLASGTYHLQAITGDRIMQARFVKQ